MGGCRCVYRRCENSTSISPGLHYFHFPVRDPPRCELWIQNAHKPGFKQLEKEKLRNKVVCSLHFEEKCFTNEKHDRLIHSAVPTLGFEDDVPENQYEQNMTDDIMLIPIDEDNTKFALPNVDFPGMSYTIFDDAVIPTSRIEEVIIQELQNPAFKSTKEQQIKSVVKQIKTKLPKLSRGIRKPMHVTFVTQNNESKNSELINRSNNNIQSYSVNTIDGDVKLEPSEPSPLTHILPDILKNEQICDESPEIQAQPDHSLSESFSLERRNENEYTMSATPVRLIQNTSINENINLQECNINEQPNLQVLTETQQIQDNEDHEQEKEQTENMENKFGKQIENNTKQIRRLNCVVRRQSRFNRMLWQRKQMPHFKKKLDKANILETLKNHVKPSLLAILKLELFPVEEVVLNDKEEKFVTELYTEHPECYELLRSKFKWNLPFAEKKEGTQKMQCD